MRPRLIEYGQIHFLVLCLSFYGFAGSEGIASLRLLSLAKGDEMSGVTDRDSILGRPLFD